MRAASLEERTAADEGGEKIATAIAAYFRDGENLRIIERLRSAGLQFEAEEREQKSNALQGKSFVISGKFHLHSRDEIKALIERHGGRNIAAVSGQVDYLVAGDNKSTAQQKKATSLSVSLISEHEFLAMISDTESTTDRPQEMVAAQKPAIEQGSLF